ncbi:MAG TPA: hypothetical protein VG714_05450 [Acidobacteriaceae bacterium]|nr:hypothetical protein [Acidobacteriaceae bacterium]
MKRQIQAAMAAVLVLGTVSLQAQTASSSSTRSSKHKKAAKETEEQQAIRELQEKLAAQQAQIDALTQQNAAKDASLSTAQSSASAAQSQAAEAQQQAQSATAAAQSQADTIKSLQSTVADQQSVNASLADNISTTKADLNDKIDSPAAIHYKGVTITPVAFFAFEGVWRQHSVNSGINTPFNNIPMPGANEGHVSELNFSGRQSRLGALFTGDAGNIKLSGYFEGDFLSSGTTSNNNQSNSYTLRQRQFWGQAALKSGFTVTGGQMWSLVTETGTGTDNRTEKLPATIDPQYMVGFNWVRQPGIRFQQRWGDYKKGAFTLAMSLEQAQITGFTAAGTIPTDFFFAGVGQNGGLYNAAGNTSGGSLTTYANNVAPDVVIKGVYDNAYTHLELGGIARFLRDYYYPVTYGTGGSVSYAPQYTSHTSAAGGIVGSARVSPDKFVTLAVQAMAGTGIGRYGSAQLADATLRPDETLEPIRNYHGLLSLETHPTPKLDVFAYYGGEYAQRTVYTTGAGNLIGYGPKNLNDGGCYTPAAPGGGSGSGGSLSAASCSSPTRYIQEGMVGFAYRPYVSAKYGRIQYSLTYQYLQRNLWSGVGSSTTPSGPRAEDGMIHWGMRYYIP